MSARDSLGRPMQYAKSLLSSILLTNLVIYSHTTLAQENLNFSGFMTLSFSQSDTNYKTDNGITNTWDIYPNSAIGFQINANVNDNTELVLQIVGKGQNDTVRIDKKEFDPDIEWAFANIQLSEHSSVKIGRFQNPLLLYSDSLNVSYTYTWVTPPQETYQLVPDSRVDGINYSYNYIADTWQYHFSLYATVDRIDDVSESEDRIGSILQVSSPKHTLRLAYSDSKLSIYTPQDLRNIPHFGPGPNCFDTESFGDLYSCQIAVADPTISANRIEQLSQDLSFENIRIKHKGIGYQYNHGPLQLMSEFIDSQTGAALLHSSRAGYISLGYQVAAFTPHITLAKSQTTDDSRRKFSSYYNSTLGSNPVLDILDQGTGGQPGSFLKANNEQRESVTLGLRWDYSKESSIKADAKYITNFNGSDGYFEDAREPNDKGVWIYRVAFTAVF